MKFSISTLVFSLACSVVPTAMAQPNAAASSAEVPAAAASDADRVICKLERPTGSNIPTRICKTAASWEWDRERSRKMIQDAQQRTGQSQSR